MESGQCVQDQGKKKGVADKAKVTKEYLVQLIGKFSK